MNSSCPVCRTALAHKIFDAVGLEECPQCAGVWIKVEALKSMESRSVGDLEEIDSVNIPIQAVVHPSMIMHCPECGLALASFNFEYDTPIQLHRCDTCDGVWVEHGQLTQMALTIEHTRGPVTVQDSHPVDDAEALAEFSGEHARAMDRSSLISGACSFLTTRLPWL